MADRQVGSERKESFEAEDGVVEIGVPRAVGEAAIGMELAAQKPGDEVGRLAQQLRRQPCDLEHFESQTHRIGPGFPCILRDNLRIAGRGGP